MKRNLSKKNSISFKGGVAIHTKLKKPFTGTLQEEIPEKGRIIESQYKNGRLHGLVIIFDQDGKIIEESKFRFGFQILNGSSERAKNPIFPEPENPILEDPDQNSFDLQMEARKASLYYEVILKPIFASQAASHFFLKLLDANPSIEIFKNAIFETKLLKGISATNGNEKAAHMFHEIEHFLRIFIQKSIPFGSEEKFVFKFLGELLRKYAGKELHKCFLKKEWPEILEMLNKLKCQGAT